MLSFSHFLVHPSVAGDPRKRAHHASFVMGHLGGAIVTAALVALVIFRLEAVPPGLWAGAVWLALSPLAIATLLRTTGDLEWAQSTSIANLTALVFALTFLTGGLASPLLPWFVLVPFEAALSGRRRLILSAVGASILGVIVLGLFQWRGMAPVFDLGNDPFAPVLQVLGLMAAIAYAGIAAAASQAAHRNLTELAQADERRYRLLTENSMDLIMRFGMDGRISFASPSAMDVLGYGASDLVGHSISEIVAGDDRRNVQSALAQTSYFAGEAMLEFRIRGPEGELIWVEMRCRPLLLDLKADADSAVLRWASRQGDTGAALTTETEPHADRPAAAFETVAIMRDITNRKRSEGALIDARDEAEANNRAKSRFLANMSHELRTPLNAIIGFSDMMMSEMFGPLGNPRYAEYVSHIKESGEHLRDVINDVLDMSKIEAGRFDLDLEQISMPLLIEDVLKTVSMAARQRKVILDVDLPPSLPRLTADRRAIKQVLLNLLSNAIKFTGEGGSVVIVARLEGPNMILEVRDTGVGISPDELEHLGQPYQQAASAKSSAEVGTGLGLALVKAFVDLHRGSFEIESEEAVGTNVSITLALEGPGEGSDDSSADGFDDNADDAPINLADHRKLG